MKRKVLVWDLATRLFHWTMAVSFFGAYFTAESEYRYFHVMFGYSLLGLVGFRLFWGCVGPKYVRFSQFVRGPVTVYRHFFGLVKGRADHHIGHNPAGAMAVMLLLLLGVISAVSGRLCYVEALRDPMEVIHGLASDIMLIVVAGHVLGVVAMSLLSRENLVLSMLTGLKLGRPEQSIHGSRPVSALMLLLLIIGFWIMALPGSPFE